MSLMNSNIKRICVENPVGYMNTSFRKPDQIVQPYYFGDTEQKRTCLWLKNLPLLNKTNVVTPKIHWISKKGNPVYFTEALVGSKHRSVKRSKTFPGIAKAMANQWSMFL